MLGESSAVGDRRSEEEEGTAAHPSYDMGHWNALPGPRQTDTTQRPNTEKQRPSGGLVPEGEGRKSQGRAAELKDSGTLPGQRNGRAVLH